MKKLSDEYADEETERRAKEALHRALSTPYQPRGFSPLIKRGVVGTFHHISQKHLPRYLREFEFRWNMRTFTDGERTEKAVHDVIGNRMTYLQPLKRV